MSKFLKGKDGGSAGGKLPAPLPGLGGKPSAAPLPGLGGKPSAAPLPGLGAKPSAAPLPGLGAKPSGGALPGIGPSKVPGVVPPFMQQPEPAPEQAPAPAAPQGPSPEQVARDPFGQPPARSSYRPSQGPDSGLIRESIDPGVSFSEADAGKNRRPLIIAGVVLGLLAFIIGYLASKATRTRGELNAAIRDARIVEWEIKKAAKLFGEVQSVVGTAFSKAKKRQYDKTHLGFLSSQIKGNPIPPQLFTERNYKTFDPAAVQWLVEYNNKWAKLDKLIQDHRSATKYDEKMLKAAGDEFIKLLQTNYGVVFARDSKQGNKFVGNVVVLGAVEEDGEKVMVKVQVDTGTFGDDRQLFNPAPDWKPEKEEDSLIVTPDKYVIELGPQSKAGLLKNATQSHFEKYAKRVKEIADLMTGMGEGQQNLLNKLSEICSQEPVGFMNGGIDVEEQFDEYVASRSSGSEG